MGPFEFDGGLLFWTVVTFLGLLAVLTRFVFKPFKQILQKREDAIRQSLEKAETARSEAESILKRNEEQLSRARDETRRIVNEGHRIVADMKREARTKAKEEADLIVSQARSEIDSELQKGLTELRSTVVNLSIRIARQVMKEETDETRHEALTDDFIERLKKSHVQRRS